MRHLSLQAKFILCLLLTTLMTIGAVVYLGSRSVQNVLQDVNSQHYRVTVLTTRDAVTDLMRIGLPLGDLRRVQELIDQSKAREPQIGSFFVYDPSGKILYSTDAGEIGAIVPADWPRTAVNTGTWERRQDLGLVVGAPLASDFGSVAGFVALRQADSGDIVRTEEQSLRLIAIALAAFLPAALLGILLLHLIMRAPVARLSEMTAILTALLASREIPERSRAWDDALEAAFDRFVDRIATIRRLITQNGAEIKRLEDQS